MANIESQKKRNRQNERRRLRNKAVRTRLRTEAKSAASAVEGGAENADERLRNASRLIDKAAAKGMIHRRTAARRKSKLARGAAGSAGS